MNFKSSRQVPLDNRCVLEQKTAASKVSLCVSDQTSSEQQEVSAMSLTVCIDWNGAAFTLMPLLWGDLETAGNPCAWEAGARAVEGGGCSVDNDMEVCWRNTCLLSLFTFTQDYYFLSVSSQVYLDGVDDLRWESRLLGVWALIHGWGGWRDDGHLGIEKRIL